MALMPALYVAGNEMKKTILAYLISGILCIPGVYLLFAIVENYVDPAILLFLENGNQIVEISPTLNALLESGKFTIHNISILTALALIPVCLFEWLCPKNVKTLMRVICLPVFIVLFYSYTAVYTIHTFELFDTSLDFARSDVEFAKSILKKEGREDIIQQIEAPYQTKLDGLKNAEQDPAGQRR